MLDQLRAAVKTPLPEITLPASEQALLASQALSAREQLISVVEVAGSLIKRQALFSMGGFSFADLTIELGKQFKVARAQAVSLADTAIMTFYRTVNARGFDVIQRDLPKQVLLYKYFGPKDVLNRPFCARLKAADRSYTRAEIDAMDNGLTPVGTVFTMAGGWNCRHLFILAPEQTAPPQSAA